MNRKDNLEVDVSQKLNTQSKALLTVIQKQKDLENSFENFSDKIDLLDHTQIDNSKDFHQNFKVLREEVLEIKNEITKLQEFNRKLKTQLKILSTKDEVQKVEKYVDFWQPINFITRDEVKEIKKDIVEKISKVIEEFYKEEK